VSQSPVPRFSFEFFPPKTAEAEEKLWAAVLALEALKPQFVSVTYGAGGTTRERTHETVKRIREHTSLKPAAHLTCVGASREEVNIVAQAYWDAGIRHIVALRGDPPKGTGAYVPHERGYVYSSDLVRGLKAIGDFEISVAAFPECHPESRDFDQDMHALRSKVEAGATRAITQYFFGTEHFLRLRDKIKQAKIEVQLVPGMIPIGHFGQLKNFSAMCGASIPDWLAKRFDGLDENPAARDAAAIDLVTEQCRSLQKEGIEQFHFYTLNRSDLTRAVCANLGVRPQ
jgi:methylenetetrahydrofolate reductase (NADPH)